MPTLCKLLPRVRTRDLQTIASDLQTHADGLQTLDSDLQTHADGFQTLVSGLHVYCVHSANTDGWEPVVVFITLWLCYYSLAFPFTYENHRYKYYLPLT